MPSSTGSDDRPYAGSREQWRWVRGFLNEHRFALTGRLLASGPPDALIPGTPLLARPSWVPERPVPLESVRLRWRPDAPAALLDGSEDYGSDRAPIDYGAWPLNRTLSAARGDGRLRLHWLGLGMDPLTYVTDMLTVAVFDADLFDETFRHMVVANDEGHRVGAEDATGRSTGVPFTAEQVERFAGTEPVQPAGAALLRLAWRHRDVILGPAGRG